jgi:hypothetical protein
MKLENVVARTERRAFQLKQSPLKGECHKGQVPLIKREIASVVAHIAHSLATTYPILCF